jgi:hypothetical protein
MKELQNNQLDARQYEYSPLLEVQGWSDVPRGQQLFETFITVSNYPVNSALADWKGPLTIKDMVSVERASYAINLVAITREYWQFELKYDSRRFSESSMDQMLSQFVTLLESFLIYSEATLETFKAVLSEEEKRQRRMKQRGFHEARKKMLETAKQKVLSKGNR